MSDTSEIFDTPDLTGPGNAGAGEGGPTSPDDVVTDDLTDIVAAGEHSEISVSADCVTLINVFTVDPENQARLVTLLTEATTDVVSGQPGFISANLHASLDGTRVTNYAQWASVADLEAMLVSPDCRPHLEACAELGDSEPHVYRVSAVHHA